MIDFIFWAYTKLNINLGKESYTPKNSLPQGGINSPILFDFAMHFMLEEFVAEYHASELEKVYTDNKISEENSYMYVDDTTFLFRFVSLSWIKVKKRLKSFFSILRK